MSMVTLQAGPEHESLRVGDREREDDPYVIVLDKDGVVRWLHHGAFDQSAASDLGARLTSLNQGGPAAVHHHLLSETAQR